MISTGDRGGPMPPRGEPMSGGPRGRPVGPPGRQMDYGYEDNFMQEPPMDSYRGGPPPRGGPPGPQGRYPPMQQVSKLSFSDVFSWGDWVINFFSANLVQYTDLNGGSLNC